MTNTMTRSHIQRRRESDAQKAKRLLRRRANRFLQQNIIKIVIIMPLVIGLLIGFFLGAKVTAYAQSMKINDYGREIKYAQYVVKSGDTIWGIATDLAALNPEYNDIRQYVNAINDANKMVTGEIKAGQVILIPYYVNEDDMAYRDMIYSKYGIGR